MVIEAHVIEELARTIHDSYRAELAERDEAIDASVDRPWNELPKDFKEANRAQARDIVSKLELIGCGVAPGTGSFTFTAEESEELSRREHLRWMKQRTEEGWTYGRVRDTALKQHPSLKPWDELSESDREKDRDAVLRIPDVLAAAGLHVVRG